MVVLNMSLLILSVLNQISKIARSYSPMLVGFSISRTFLLSATNPLSLWSRDWLFPSKCHPQMQLIKVLNTSNWCLHSLWTLRREHKRISPSLEQGSWVLSPTFEDCFFCNIIFPNASQFPFHITWSILEPGYFKPPPFRFQTTGLRTTNSVMLSAIICRQCKRKHTVHSTDSDWLSFKFCSHYPWVIHMCCSAHCCSVLKRFQPP